MNPSLRVALAICALMVAASFIPTCMVNAQENPRSEARAMVLTEAEGAALATPHDAVKCFQERQHGRTHVCITETEWMRQHEDDKNGEKTQALLPAVAGAD